MFRRSLQRVSDVLLRRVFVSLRDVFRWISSGCLGITHKLIYVSPEVFCPRYVNHCILFESKSGRENPEKWEGYVISLTTSNLEIFTYSLDNPLTPKCNTVLRSLDFFVEVSGTSRFRD